MERHAAELHAAHRQAEELAIKKLEAQKKRPRWMIGVTIAAVVAAGVLGTFTVKAIASSDDAEQAAAAARHAGARPGRSPTNRRTAAQIVEINTQLDQLEKEVAASLDDPRQGAG